MSTPLITIPDESGMNFGPFERSRCFYIEKSQVYGTIQEDVKMVEFLLLRTNNTTTTSNPEIWIVEAKSSSPRPRSESGDKSKFKKFIDEIREKLINALTLGLASMLGRHPQFKSELPAAFTEINLSQVQIKFVLVMKDHPRGSLALIKAALENALRPTIKTWGFGPNSVIVINESLARKRKYGLIDAPP